MSRIDIKSVVYRASRWQGFINIANGLKINEGYKNISHCVKISP